MMMHEPDPRPRLVGDVGGTKVLLGLLRPGRAVCKPSQVRTFESRSFDSLAQLVEAFLHGAGGDRPTLGLLAVAGPVIDRRARITNLPWTIDAVEIADALSLRRIDLINDLEALAWAVPALSGDDLAVLRPGKREKTGTVALLAPGTGLGEAYLTWVDGRYVAHPSEGGHADFAPANERQSRLLSFLWEEYEHVSVERIASGIGLPNLHRFVRSIEEVAEAPEVESVLAAAEDPTPVIIDAAMEGRSPACVEAVRLFVEILAAEAGNLALKLLASGGVFLGGGIPPRILPFLRSSAFDDALLRKGRFTDFVERTPISVILDPLGVLRGAAVRAATEPFEQGVGPCEPSHRRRAPR
jgi:glucokinase